MSRNILVVASHPDDEWFSLGGTLLKFKKMYYDIHILVVTNGERGDNCGPTRIKGSEDLCKIVFGTNLKTFGIPANEVPRNNVEATSMLDVVIHQLQPEIILTHYPNDSHQDHRAVFDIVQSSLRAIPKAEVWLFESPWAIDFSPNIFVDISMLLEKKLEIYKQYFEEEYKAKEKYGYDIVRILSEFRGTQAGVSNAEGFKLYRRFFE